MKSIFITIFLLVLFVILAQCDAKSIKKRSARGYNSYNQEYKNDDDVYIVQDDDYADHDADLWLYLLPLLFANRRNGGLFRAGYGNNYMF